MSWGGRKVAKARAQLLARYGHAPYCAWCGLPIVGTVSVDHIVPRSRGGTDDIDNLQPMHPACNSAKGAGRRRQSRRW